jgi:hypothetical protein
MNAQGVKLAVLGYARGAWAVFRGWDDKTQGIVSGLIGLGIGWLIWG